MSTRGPKILTFTGVGLLIIWIGSLAFAIFGGVSPAPPGIVNAQGQPGTEALLAIEPSGHGSLDSPGEISYVLWEVARDEEGRGLRSTAVEVLGPDGEDVLVRAASVSAYVDYDGGRAHSFAEFRASEAGAYQIMISPAPGRAGDSSERVIVAEETDFGDVKGTLLSGWGLLFLRLFTGTLGVALSTGGIIWWVLASNRNKRVAEQHGPIQPGGSAAPSFS